MIRLIAVKLIIGLAFSAGSDQNAQTIPQLDICGGAANYSTSGPPQSSGYITSPGYPSDYQPNAKCTCTLVGLNGSLIIIEILDYDLVPIPNEILPSDWMEYTWRDDQDWGGGQRINSRTKRIQTGSSIVRINFQTNSKYSAKGFLIQYTGINPDEKSNGEIYAECSGYVPPDYRRSSACLTDSHASELYLSCPWPGVINVMRVYRSSTSSRLSSGNSSSTDAPAGAAHSVQNNLLMSMPKEELTFLLPAGSGGSKDGSSMSLKSTKNSGVCAPSDNCYESLYRLDAVLNQCMRRMDCLYSARATNVPMCNEPSDHVHVDYYCIPIDDNTMDACGEDRDFGTVLEIDSGEGYVNSPDYPSIYPPDMDCQCKIEGLGNSIQIILILLDVQLDNKTMDGSYDGDLLEFWTQDNRGVLSHELRLNEFTINAPIYTGSNVVYLRMVSDSKQELRGFWLKYIGRTPDGEYAPIRINCSHTPVNDRDYRTSSRILNPSTTPEARTAKIDSIGSRRKGLIVGLSVLAGVIIIALILIAACLYHRRTTNKKNDTSFDSSTDSISSTHRFTSGRTTLVSQGSRAKYLEKGTVYAGPGPNASDHYKITAYRSIGYKSNDPTRYRTDARQNDPSSNQ